MDDFKQCFFDAPNISGEGTHRIAYLDWNSDCDQVLVCVHGLTRNAHDFDYVAAALKDDYRIISIDMAGRGQSDLLGDSDGYCYATYFADCVALLTHLQLASVDWLGTSMGGIIGMQLAAAIPNLIRRLIVNDVGVFIPKEALSRIMSYVSATPKRFASELEAQEHLRQNMKTFGIETNEEWAHIFKYSILKADDDYHLAYDHRIMEYLLKQSDHGKNSQDVDLRDLWNLIQVPTLIIRGGDSKLLPQAIAEEMLEGRDNAKLVVFDGVGHAPALMSVAQVSVITGWLWGN